ncbi:MAG: hypothetical protein HC798_03960 [Polaribacter sp.]|nr:hypothetical protein [Polaribacter sp.]
MSENNNNSWEKQELLVLQYLKELKEESNKSAHFRENVLIWQNNTSHKLNNVEEDLREHMRRTDLLEGLYNSNEKRLSKLEEPGKVLKFLKSYMVSGAAIITATITIYKTLQYFNLL